MGRVNSTVTSRADLATAKRVVVKVGSSSLTDAHGHLDVEALTTLVDVLAQRHADGGQVVLVSSGAIAAGLTPLGLHVRPRDLATAQAAASVGQGLLIARYTQAFGLHGIRVGQVLLTVEDTIRRGHYRNARRAFSRLLDLGVVPVVNENDTVVTDEIRFGDNDRLAALVAHLTGADALVLLSDVDALYTAKPGRPDSRKISHVTGRKDLEGIDVSARGSRVGTGGMVTKLDAAAISTGSGIPVLLTSAGNAAAALAGEDVGTYFAATGRRRSPRLLWLEHAARTHGRVVLDDGAVRAVVEGRKSLLPAGVTAVEGQFDAGDPIELVSLQGVVVARGLVCYDSTELPAMLGRSTKDLRAELGPRYEREIAHRDDIVIVRR
ncbi:MAG: glutamate 5-kinase [Actinomycetales bacterium]|nr:glutamate 5-kinase [Actinomycetales bacterium]